jgi:hypothetical protein
MKKMVLLAALAALPAHAQGLTSVWSHDTYELFDGTVHRVMIRTYGGHVSVLCFPSGHSELAVIGNGMTMMLQLGQPKVGDLVSLWYRVDEREDDGGLGAVVSYVNSSRADAVSVALGHPPPYPEDETRIPLETLTTIELDWFLEDARAGNLLRVELTRTTDDEKDHKFFFAVPLAGFTAAYEQMPAYCGK